MTANAPAVTTVPPTPIQTTAAAAVRLIRKLGGEVVGVLGLIELKELGGRERLPDVEVVSEIVY